MTFDNSILKDSDGTFWKVLGIEPTRDLTAIRQAYAQQARRCHPEDDPRGFQTLRKAYEAAMGAAMNALPPAQAPNDEKITSPAPKEPLPPTPGEVFTSFCSQLDAGSPANALATLATWWFDPAQSEPAKREFNRLLLDRVLNQGMPQPLLAQLAWQIYWPGERLNFPVEAPAGRVHAFQQRLLQAIQVSVWDIRGAFATSLANGQAERGVARLAQLLASPAFDHLARRHLLRVTMLRYIADHKHIEAEILTGLNRLFQFRHFLETFSGGDLAKAQALCRKIDGLAPPSTAGEPSPPKPRKYSKAP